MPEESTFTLTYRFRFPDGEEKVFPVELDRKTCALIQDTKPAYPEWTKLSYKQCGHCPLNTDTHPHCPVAVSIVDIVEFFYDAQSIEQADVVVETDERFSTKRVTNLHPAISSLIGIHMVSSGCPVMNKLRPMVRHHLPFASAEETIYRALSMYALAQYFRKKNGMPSEDGFSGLSKIYQDINRLNLDFSRRLKTDSDSDATMNAITGLDCFAQIIDVSISEEMLEDVESLFAEYLDGHAEGRRPTEA